MEALGETVAESNLTVINDYCQAPGAKTNGVLAGEIGDVGVCSFGAPKPLTTGEGGIVTTDDPDLAPAVRRARDNSGVNTVELPINVRMSDVEAAIGRTQLDRYSNLVARRRALADTYQEELPSVVTPQSVPDEHTHVYHRFAIRAPERDALADYLAKNDVETSVGITKPLSEFSCIQTLQVAECPETMQVLDDYLLLPMHPRLDTRYAREIALHVMNFYS
ncbi:DegT/DnrJ/EryC1/StrS family aminotransferase [Halobacterium salinarum]|uniref:DegT/DnrJ/EryC1/StrS family aminotransferase n=1 Tax=Halobacterium salinarum TaxID=2242 RepID=UPI0025538A0E|nr:DegT/DnrJ/EryC1/StrS family aminotransferase [Halobacterium salinarum]MDL0120425.1 DegT/DnrJ/EryC1/StrS family aminotransferase [Halobacterium salinarum]